MQKRFLYFATFLLFHHSLFAQQEAVDSLWFASYFSRIKKMRDTKNPAAYDSLEVIKSIAEQKKLYYYISQYHVEKSGYFLAQNKTDSAIAHLKSAITLGHNYSFAELEGRAFLNLANLYQFNGNALVAAENYIKATRLLKKSGKIRTLVSIYRNLHTVLGRLHQKNNTLQNTYIAIATKKSSVKDLIQIINAQESEDTGFYFPDQSLIRESGTDAIYVIFGNAKFAITGPENLGSYGSTRDVQLVPPGTLSKIPDFPRNGSVMREQLDGFIFLAKDGFLHPITQFEVLELFGGWDGVYFVPPGSLKKFPVSKQRVTIENASHIFNFGQSFDVLTDSIQSALQKNKLLSAQLSNAVSSTNAALQNRKILLWVFSIGLIALLLIVLLLIRNFRQKQRLATQTLLAVKREEELQRIKAIEKERTRIATDMHDDLGAGLSRIKFLSETIGIKKQKEQPFEEDVIRIREYSHEMINKMGEIVWALNEKNDSLNDLLSFTRVYAIEYLTQNGIGCQVLMSPTIDDRFLSGEFRRNIFLSVKELLHNVVKHAAAKNVTIKFELTNRLHIWLEDDGCGFDPGNIRPFSNGINNVHKRMKEINGSFQMKSNEGTQVHLSIPT